MQKHGNITETTGERKVAR
uniref:Uncharacterized protein n=1 Tax=Anguilla anguilla TaxID=7936 RepID=A0A0E9RXJ8_ANGAN